MKIKSKSCYTCIIIVWSRAVKNLENSNLSLSWKFEVFWGLASKNFNVLNLNYPQNLILNLKNAVLILNSNFEIFFDDP